MRLRQRAATSAWARHCASGVRGRWCGRALQAPRPAGLVLSSTRHKPPRWASKSCRAPGRDHAAFALGHCAALGLQSPAPARLQAEQHLEVIVAVAAGRRSVAPQ